MSPQREPTGSIMVGPNHLENQTSSGRWAVHAGVALLGSIVLLVMAWPLQNDGLFGLDGFAVVFLAVSGLAAAGVGGALEGLASRAGQSVVAAAILVIFAVVALWAPGVMSGRWFAADDSAMSTSSLGLAMTAYALTVALEAVIAWLFSRRANT